MNETQKNALLEDLLKGNSIALNANDFFCYACADVVLLEFWDLEWVLPIYEEYRQDGLNACMAYIAKTEPVKEYLTKKFRDAYSAIEKLNPKVHSEY